MTTEKSIFNPLEKDDIELKSNNNYIPEVDLHESLIPYANKISQISFEVDLIQKAIFELDLLQLFHHTPGIYDEENVRRAIYRYEKYWLPLMVEYSSSQDLEFAPPLDVHWVWHVHLLCPHAYNKDCLQVVGRLIGHQLCSKDQLQQRRNRARTIWNRKFPNEPFDVLEQPACYKTMEKFDSQISYSIVEASSRQNSFYYQVSLPHYRDVGFQRDSLLRYKMFLHLKKMHTKKFLVPCYDIDLLWHTHQLHPQVYRNDTTEILGFVLNHDDNFTDRSEGSQLANADSDTRTLWYKTYKVPFARPGCMYRGNEPQGRLCPLGDSFNAHLISGRNTESPMKTTFTIKPGTFSDCIIPETAESLWGPVPLQKLPQGVDNECRAVVHDIQGGVTPLTAHILHSLPLLMSAIQIYRGDKMALVAHLVGVDQIGYETRLGLTPDVMKNKRNWRAMLLKDSEGDWGMAVACWRGMRQARQAVKSGIKSNPRVKGKPGYFMMKFVNLRHPERKSDIIKLPIRKDKFKFRINNTKVDLKEGIITVKPEEKDVVQSIALSFVTSILYLMVQPRPKNLEYKRRRSSRKPLWQGNSNIDFLNWCGWEEVAMIPTNFTLHNSNTADGGGCGGCGGGCGGGEAYGTVGGMDDGGGDDGCFGGDAGTDGCGVDGGMDGCIGDGGMDGCGGDGGLDGCGGGGCSCGSGGGCCGGCGC